MSKFVYTTMEAVDKDEIKWVLTCRICLNSEDQNMKSIFSDISLAEDIATKIIKCGGIPVNIFDGMPDRICDRCFLDLEIAYRFRNVCQQSYQRLNEMINTKENKQFRSEDTSITELNYETDHEENSHDEMLNTNENKQLICEDTTIIEIKHESDTEDISAEYCDLRASPKQDISQGEFLEMPYINEETLVNNYSQESEIEANEIEHKSNQTERRDSINQTKPNGRRLAAKCEMKPRKGLKRFCKDKPTSLTTNYICYLCGNLYKNKSKLGQHIKQHTAEKAHECEICGKKFAHSAQLSRHMNSHTGNRPYKCKYCPSSFADPSTCIKHERIHTNDRPFKCLECGKAFAYSNVLKVHLTTHTGEKPFSCSICDKKFSQQHHKKSHERRTHSNVTAAGAIVNKVN